MSRLSKIAFASTLLVSLAGFSPASFAAPIIYQGIDVGASSFAAATNSQTASGSFDSATGPLNIIDFDTHTTGATLSPASSPQSCGFALCGGNTTAGGANFYGAVYSTTITFDTPVDAFGAYFTGWQRDDQVLTLTYTNSAIDILNMPAGDLGQGGMIFFGFIDSGASIASVTYSTALGDYVGIDDIRFGTAATPIPEPGTLALLGLGLALATLRRRS